MSTTEDVGNMGKLTPGSKYTYEKIDGVTYAQEEHSTEKVIIGYDWAGEDQQRGRSMRDGLMEDKLWGDIRRAAKTNPALQKALEQCIIVYHLSKDKPKPPDWHPV